MITKIAQNSVTHIYMYDYEDAGYEWVDQIYKPDCLDRLFGSKEEDISAYYLEGVAGTYNFKWSKEEVERDRRLEDRDGKLFYKPCIKVYIGAEHVYTKFFETLQDAIKFCNKNFPEVNIVL